MILVTLASLICIPLLYVLLDYFRHVLSLKRYPPGPFPLPVIGNLHLLGQDLHLDFQRLSKTYGDVYGLSFGMNRLVIVNAYGPAREALVTKGAAFEGRGTSSNMLAHVSRNFKDLIFADYGPHWKFHRKLVHTALISYGEENQNIDDKIKMEGDALNERLRKAGGQPVDILVEFGCCILNVICAISFGQRYDVEDEEFQEIINFNNLIMESLGFGDTAAYLPWLRLLPSKNWVKLKEGVARRDKVLQRKVKQRRETYNPNVVRDFVDSLIKTFHDKTVFKGIENNQDRNEGNLDILLADMVIAGSETTVTGLRWLVVYLLHWPDIQTAVYKEIITAVGNDRRYPELDDQPNLPLTLATIQEMLRFASFTPFGVPHKATKDSSISGLNIPKNTELFFNTWSVNHDEREYSDPESFDPNRWLDESGKYDAKKNRSFLPFSAGRRGCLGENLARKELFYIFTRLVRDFQIEPNSTDKLPSLRGKTGGTITPDPFTAVFRLREE